MHKIHMALQPDLFDNEDELICLQRVQQGGLQVLLKHLTFMRFNQHALHNIDLPHGLEKS